MDPCMQSRLIKGLEKTLTFKSSIKQIFTASSVIEYLSDFMGEICFCINGKVMVKKKQEIKFKVTWLIRF